MLDAAAPSSLRRSWEVSRVLKKIITWAVVVFIVYYLVTNPAGAAAFVTTVFNWLKSAAAALVTFFNSL